MEAYTQLSIQRKHKASILEVHWNQQASQIIWLPPYLCRCISNGKRVLLFFGLTSEFMRLNVSLDLWLQLLILLTLVIKNQKLLQVRTSFGIFSRNEVRCEFSFSIFHFCFVFRVSRYCFSRLFKTVEWRKLKKSKTTF